MARLFRVRTHTLLQDDIFQCVKPANLARIQTRDAYDDWLIKTVELDCWKSYSRNGIDLDRWAYFAKLINIVVYEIVTNRELFGDADWQRLQHFLHIPIDGTVKYHLSQIDPNFPIVKRLKGMSKEQYLRIQNAVRQLSDSHHLPPIWFEAVWSA
ncbi:MAG: hypothetical protein ACE5GU_12925 [Candidatus Scalinduaceae bacterium]